MINRRSFLKSLISETIAAFEEAHGKPNYKLADLWTVSDETLGQMTPALAEKTLVDRSEGRLTVRAANDDQAGYCVQADSPQSFIIDHFDGNASLLSISSQLARQWSMQSDSAFETAKKVFLALVRRGLCAPRNAHPDADGDP
ncbi:MAG: hypothetical protein Q7T82_21530 [Armatimonadota bacterium]|nr:hypothetical protein [Armatimonadota bacterium]